MHPASRLTCCITGKDLTAGILSYPTPLRKDDVLLMKFGSLCQGNTGSMYQHATKVEYPSARGGDGSQIFTPVAKTVKLWIETILASRRIYYNSCKSLPISRNLTPMVVRITITISTHSLSRPFSIPLGSSPSTCGFIRRSLLRSNE